MSDVVTFQEQPETKELYMIIGWRQWADAGSMSSGLPQYLIQETKARKIGTISPDGFYLFQIPGTHDLVRPMVHFDEGYPTNLDTQRNEFYYTGDSEQGVVFFLGDEPHMDAERYVTAILEAAQTLGVKRIVSLAGVYGELPYDKERLVSCIYSLPELQDEINELAVNLSDYHGGASIGSYICRRASERNMEYVGFYAFVPTYDFSGEAQIGKAIRIENDFTAWLGVMKRLNHMLKTQFDLSDLERRSRKLIKTVEAKVDELENTSPQLEVRAYIERLSEQFTEVTFDPLADVWEEEIRRLFDDPETGEQSS